MESASEPVEEAEAQAWVAVPGAAGQCSTVSNGATHAAVGPGDSPPQGPKGGV